MKKFMSDLLKDKHSVSGRNKFSLGRIAFVLFFIPFLITYFYLCFSNRRMEDIPFSVIGLIIALLTYEGYKIRELKKTGITLEEEDGKE